MIKKLISKYIFPYIGPLIKLHEMLLGHMSIGSIVILEINNEILIVRHSYGSGTRGVWTLPGGRIEKGETPKAAAIREVKEEVDICIENPIYLGTVSGGMVHCYMSKVDNRDFNKDNFEIVEARWVNPDVLPRMRHNALEAINKMKKWKKLN